MKLYLKLIIPVLAILFFAGNACKKEYEHLGIITGFDQRFCPCCGGLMINFKGETEPYQGEFYLITNQPEEFGIGYNSTFPIHIKVDYTTEACTVGALGNLIKITRFRKL